MVSRLLNSLSIYDPHAISTPKILNNKYKVIKILGEGGFGIVYHAKDCTTNEDVAIKVFEEEYKLHGIGELLNLQRLAILDPDNKYLNSKIIGFFVENAQFCIVLILLGSTISDFLLKNSFRPYSMKEIKHIAYQLCFQINFMHKNDFLHGDIKPSNILFVSSKYRLTQYSTMLKRKHLINTQIKLIDFGFSTTILDNNKIPCTHHYRSPEMLLGLKWCQASEVFSIGCVLFELYTGRTLFIPETDVHHLKLMHRVLGPIPKSMLKKSRIRKNLLQNKQRKAEKIVWCTGRKMYLTQKKQHKPLKTYKLRKTKDDEDFFNLLRKMLRYKPEKRITLEQALKHPFFYSLPNNLKIKDVDLF